MPDKDENWKEEGNVHGRLNASWKICSLAVNGQSFLVIDGYLLNLGMIASFPLRDEYNSSRLMTYLSRIRGTALPSGFIGYRISAAS